MHQEMIPLRFKNRGLSGLGDLIDDYQNVLMTISDSYGWLQRARDAVNATRAASLITKWNALMLTGENLRQRAAAIHYQPSVTGFIENLFGAPSNLPIIGTIDRAMSSDMAVYTADGQQFIADTAQLKLAVDQYNRLIASGVSATDASNTIDQAQEGFFSKIGHALEWPAIGIGSVVALIALLIFAPEIKAGLSVLKKSRQKRI